VRPARSTLIPLLAAASLVLAGCGSAGGPTPAPAGPGVISAPAGALDLGVTNGRLGDAVTQASGGHARELSTGGPLDRGATRIAPNRREGVAAGDNCANSGLLPDASNLAATTDATLCLLNAERSSRGLAALRPNDKLQRAALAHGSDMVEHLYFAHEGLDGSQPAERIRAAGYLAGGGAWHIGENLAWGTGDLATPKAIMAAWMGSAGHRANILQPAYREIGFGVLAGNPATRGGGGATFITEFGVVDRPVRTASQRARGGSERRPARRAAARARARRAETRRARHRARARRARAHRARVALAPRSRRGRTVGSVGSRRAGLG
jgi:uncharacterized protein YkwD